jgi:hypothetical protein
MASDLDSYLTEIMDHGRLAHFYVHWLFIFVRADIARENIGGRVFVTADVGDFVV